MTADEKIEVLSLGDKVVLTIDAAGAAKDKTFTAVFETKASQEVENEESDDSSDSGSYDEESGWVSKDGKWQYVNSNGKNLVSDWGHIGDKWYFFDSNGNSQTGWINWNGLWYFAKEDSSMASEEWD